MPTTEAATINADLLAFIKGVSKTGTGTDKVMEKASH